MSLPAFLLALAITVVNFSVAAYAISKLPIDRRYKIAAIAFVGIVLLTWLLSGVYLYHYGLR